MGAHKTREAAPIGSLDWRAWVVKHKLADGRADRSRARQSLSASVMPGFRKFAGLRPGATSYVSRRDGGASVQVEDPAAYARYRPGAARSARLQSVAAVGRRVSSRRGAAEVAMAGRFANPESNKRPQRPHTGIATT